MSRPERLSAWRRTNPNRLPVAGAWWKRTEFAPGIAMLREPCVADVLRCNVWRVAGERFDLVVDTGLGLAPLLPHLKLAPDRQAVVVLTHTHADHAGGWHEFRQRWVHRDEAEFVDPATATPDIVSLWSADLDPAENAHMREAGYEMPECFVTALPYDGFDLNTLPHHPAAPTRLLVEGDVIDLGNRAFEVLHLPGHSPGSIGLYDARGGLLFSGDAVYDGPLLDELAGSDIEAYVETMRRLARIRLDTVLPGHGAAFGPERLRELATDYITRRATAQGGTRR